MSKTTLLCGIFCFFGISKEFSWEQSYTLSLSLLILCAGAAASIGFIFKHQNQYHGLFLFALFIVVGALQYFNNSSLHESIHIEATLT